MKTSKSYTSILLHGRGLRSLLLMSLLLLLSLPSGLLAQTAKDTIFCVRLYAPGDYGSANWRIPALLCLDNGTLLAVCDRRKNNEADLPQDIDIVCRRSFDGGRTWSQPITIAEGGGASHGRGDAAIVQTGVGEVVCLFAGDNGYWNSTFQDPINVYCCRSTDRGRTWSSPERITSALWSSTSAYHGAFVASGNGLRLQHLPHKGRLLFCAAMCRNDDWLSDNYVIYSDDDGHTWQRSSLAFRTGDEAKLVELSDGRVLLSTRRQGERGYNISNDGGQTWGPQGLWPDLISNACNGDIIRLNDSTLVHSLPASLERRNVSLYFSYDEGRTWSAPQQICDGPSVYSSLTVLPDGSLGMLVERNPSGECEIWFYRIPKNYLP